MLTRTGQIGNLLLYYNRSLGSDPFGLYGNLTFCFYLREELAPDSVAAAAVLLLALASCDAALFLRSTLGGGSIFFTALPSAAVCIKLNGIEQCKEAQGEGRGAKRPKQCC